MAHEITSSSVFTAYITSLSHTYADEACHQEGEDYFKDYFSDDDAVIDDFILWIQSSRETRRLQEALVVTRGGPKERSKDGT
jgi:hypothetical protein